MSKYFEQIGLRPHLSKNERLPKSYKEVEKVLKDVKACKGNLKTVLNNSRLRGAVFKKVYCLATNILKQRHILERIIQETELLKKETFLREELAGILIYELVFGKGLSGESRPVTIVKQYEDSICKAYENAMKDGSLDVKGLQSLPRYVRVNTLLTSVSDVLKNLRKAGFREICYGENISEKEYLDLVRNLETGNFLIDYHFKDLLVFASTENLNILSLYQKKHVFIQDKSSYIPVYALDPKPGIVVLDACAAPGMKTIHIAAAMENNGKIYAYEKNENRHQILKDMLDSATVKICEAKCEDFYLVNANDPKFRDLECILVDPSCSGSGMVNRMDSVTDTEDSKNATRLQKLAGFQILLLKHALTFPSVKRVVYSTCSISETENEYVVHEVLNHFHHIFKLVSVMPNWQIRGSDSFEFGKLCLRAHPEETLTNGFFVAMFERLDYDEQLNVSRPFSNRSSKKKRKQEHFGGRDSNSVGINYNKNEPLNNNQFLDCNSSSKPHNLYKKKKKGCNAECDFNKEYSEDKDGHSQFVIEKRKKEKHFIEINDEYESMTKPNFRENNPNGSFECSNNKLPKKSIKEEATETVNNSIKRLSENTAINTIDVDFLNSHYDENPNYPDESSCTNDTKSKKKKHKKEVSSHEDNVAMDDKMINNIEQLALQNELDENEAEIKTKKHKLKKRHIDNVDCLNSHYPNYLDGNSCTNDTKRKKKKHKKEVSSHEDNVAMDDKIMDNVEQPILENGLDENETEIKTKKHKHKKRQVDCVDFLNSYYPTYLDGNSCTNDTKRKKKKHKKEVSSHEDNVEMDDKMMDNIEQPNLENGSDEMKAEIKTKKHKHKKKHSENTEVWNNLEIITENKLPECENIYELKNTLPRNKHKEKHSKKFSEVTDFSSEIPQDIDRTSLTKKHKKKCKDKRYKEE